MTRKKVQSFWWWRRGAPNFSYNAAYFTLDHIGTESNEVFRRWEFGAFFYEIAQRHERGGELSFFNVLPFEDQQFWAENVEKSPQVMLRMAAIPTNIDGDIEDERKYSEAIQLNLNVSDNALLGEVKKFVADQRRQKKVLPPPPNVARRRPVSWRWVELLDLKHYDLLPVWNDNERSALSAARRCAEEAHDWMAQIVRNTW